MLSKKELNWMSENAAEIAAQRAAAAATVFSYTRTSDGATAKTQDGKCIELSLAAPDRDDPYWDELPRIGCRAKILRDNGFERVEE